jgi:hypothetical protein
LRDNCAQAPAWVCCHPNCDALYQLVKGEARTRNYSPRADVPLLRRPTSRSGRRIRAQVFPFEEGRTHRWTPGLADHLAADSGGKIKERPQAVLGTARFRAIISDKESHTREEKDMKSFILFLALVCGGVNFVLYTDRQFISGSWAGQICRSAGSLCHNPQLLAFGAGGLLALWLPMVFLSAIRD